MRSILFKSKIVRDTVLLTIMQLALDSAALMINAFITRRLGASAIGVLTLTGTFLGFAGILSNGNAFLCTSRLISEELGKPDSAPERVLAYGITLCMILSTAVSVVIFVFAGTISTRFFGGTTMLRAIRLMPAALVCGAAAACFKGYFNACRKAAITAAVDICEFAVRSCIIATAALNMHSVSEGNVCTMMIAGIIAGNLFSLLFCISVFIRTYTPSNGRCTLDFRRYASLAFPIMGGSILTAALSSANDALIPVCLRQYGDSLGSALSSFGLFEAIVIPAIFFPSVVLCSMSGIIVSETARAAAAGDNERIRSLISRLTEWTLMYSVFASAVMIRTGGQIGEMLGGGVEAGRMIAVIAPVIPFIYMEVILEAAIKGMGMQSFSSLNYLVEYAVRIAVVLVFVPRAGFWGIAASYYASNIIGNCSRLIKILRTTGARPAIFRDAFFSTIYVYMTMCSAQLIISAAGLKEGSMITTSLFVIIWGTMYAAVLVIYGKIRLSHSKNGTNFVRSTQLSTAKLL